MSSMIKKKGVSSFKPKGPQFRKQPRAPPSARQSVERQSQTPTPTGRATAFSPPPVLTQRQDLHHEPPSFQNAAPEAVPDQSLRAAEEINSAADASHTIQSHNAQGNYETEDSSRVTGSRDEIVTAGGDDDFFAPLQTPSAVSHSSPLGPPRINQYVAESTNPNVTISQDVPVQGSADLSIMGPEETIQASEVIPTAELNPDGTSGAVIAPVLEETTKRPSKRRKLDKNGLEIRQSIEVQVNKPRRVASEVKKPRRPRGNDGEAPKRKQRAETPEDAENQEIDHSTVKMAELTKDLRIGKKFSKHGEIKKREQEKKMKAKLARDHPELVRGQANADGTPQSARREEAPPEASSGPQMRIVNGQIVIDDASLMVDRHARAAATATDVEEVEEDDFTRITTSGTHMKREMNIYWDAESTEKFYNGIRMFGTDFEMVSKMFPDRNRRQIKLKFNKEEREFPKRISNALIGEVVKMDLEEYKFHTGLEYEAVDDIEAEHAQLEAEHEAEQLRLQAEAEETVRQKRAEIQAGANPRGPNAARASGTEPTVEPAPGTDSAKENEPVSNVLAEGGKVSAASKSKKKATIKKKRKNMHSNRGGGDEVEVLGSIDDL